jgi:hypothetical protein
MEFQTVFQQNPWQGTIEFSESGAPYYSAEQSVTAQILFPKKGRCILVRQLAEHKYFDWSVVNIQLGLSSRTAISEAQ